MATRRRNRKSKPPVVLVVEDEPTIRALAVSIIEDNLGWRTLSAADAREALALLEEGADASFLFTDIELPGSAPPRDGFELAHRARELQPELRVSYTSGRDQTDGMRALAVEGAIFLSKPYTPEQLLATLRKLAETG